MKQGSGDQDLKQAEEQLTARRQALHAALSLPDDRPLLRRCNALDFSNDPQPSGRLRPQPILISSSNKSEAQSQTRIVKIAGV